MDLTATEVENREFREARKGYVREEVDRFLDEVAAQFRRYEERLTSLAQRVAALEAELSQSRETEEVTRRMLLVAQRASDEAVAEAEERAKAIIEEAEQKKVGIDDEVRRRRAALETDIEALRRFEGEFRAQLRQVLENHLAVLQRTGRSASDADDEQAAATPAVPATAAPPAAPAVRAPEPTEPKPAGPPAGPAAMRSGPPPVRVADNEVLRRLAEGSRPEPGPEP